jgi:pimeloyl-ACP methyl ester carboxylesterase
VQDVDTHIERVTGVLRERVAGWRLALLLTAVISIRSAGVVNAAVAEDSQRSVESFGAVEISSCEITGVAQSARCGALNLPENPDRPSARRLPISVAVIPATGGQALPDPIVVLMGGPGEDAISAAAVFANQFAPLREDRDLLLVDQRGTGQSAALRCDLYSAEDAAASLRDIFPLAAVERCKRRLSARADLTQYTYAHFANDLEHVRRALGYGRLNLFAGSYGTRAAQVYLRAYPQSVRTVYLGSVVPIDVATPLPFAKTAQIALESTFSACATDSACHIAFPNLRDEFRRVLARLESGVVRVSVPGHTGTVPIYRGRVAEWFRAKLYRPKSAALLPWIIHRAYVGDWTPIVEGILSDAREGDSDLSFGLFFSITCNEDVAFVPEEAVMPETQGTFLGDYRLRQQQAACRQWPKASLPKDYRTPVRSSVPTLFASGDTDGGTPLWFMEHVAQGFSDRVQVVLRGQGHTEWNDCVGQLYEQFVRSGEARGFGTAACQPLPRPPFKIR